jgi:DNA-binding transcriptional ArsR family regulator
MDLIVAVCRALANRTRLRLLRAIHAKPGITVQHLAEEAGLAVAVASKHLHVLRGFHLVAMTPKGRQVQCSPAQPGSTNNKFLQDIQALLAELLGEKKVNLTLSKVWDSAADGGWDEVFDALVKLFTAYTHLRRLLILRSLACRKACRLGEISVSVGMSPSAMHRHMDKLRRRGLVATATGDDDCWMLVPAPSPFCRGRLRAIVVRALTGR